MSIKFLFVFGLLLVSSFAEKRFRTWKETSAKAKAEVVLRDVKIGDEKLKDDETAENTEFKIKASCI